MKNVDTEDMVKIIQDYSPYIRFLSKKYYMKGGTVEDLFEEGVIGIIEACKDYKGDSLFDLGFDRFVKVCIKRQMFDAIRKSDAKKNSILNNSVSYSTMLSSGEEGTVLDIFLDRNFSNDPLDIFIDKEKIEEKLKICDSELNDSEKQVLKLYLSGQKQSEIAKNLNKEVKFVDNTLQRIKSKLNKIN